MVNLHVHSCMSLLDSIAKIEDIVDFVDKNKQEAVCISDHGNLSALITSHKLARERGLKCLSACEIYEVDDDEFKSDTKEYRQPYYHLLLIARNNVGLHNLIQIVSYANIEGKYKKPRISINRIQNNGWGKGIICCTACQGGRLSKYLCSNKVTEAEEFVDNLEMTFDKVYCELQSHNTEGQAFANKFIYKFSVDNNLPYVITSDAHMIKKEDETYQAMFVRVGEAREVGESYVDCFMQTEEDVYRILGSQFPDNVIQQGIDATKEICDMCEQVDVGLDNEPQMPHIEVPAEYKDSTEYLRFLCYKDFDKKFSHLSEEEKQKRRDRIDMEIPVLRELDFVDYLIMLNMISEECRRREIPLGYSRGSGGNCLCLYMLNVTQIDSVRWDLDFSRFANIGRKGTLADYDFDVDKLRRGDMIQVMKDLFGEGNVCNIATFNTFTNKVAIRDIGKVLNEKEDSPYYGEITQSLIDQVAKTIPVIKVIDEFGEEIEIDYALKTAIDSNDELKKNYNKYPMWFDYAIKLSGLPKSRGMHASAIMITPKPIKEYCSICLGEKGDIMYEAEMHALMDDIKLIKMDCLGLKNLSIADITLKFAGLTWKDVDINHLDLCDKDVYKKVYKPGNTIGIFQMESAEAKRMLIEAQADNIEDIIVVNSANRPGTKDSFPDYCHNKLHPNDVTVVHNDLKELFKQSHSVLLYQEQALSLLRYAGFPEEEVETGRKAIGKKNESAMKTLKPKFINGLKAKWWEDKQIKYIWDLLLKQSEYCFNRGHAVAYSLLSYLTAWLKVHYPIEFMTACLIMDDSGDKTSTFLSEAQRMGFRFVYPDINSSEIELTPDKARNEIVLGLGSINGLSKAGIKTIMENRPYISFADFIKTDALTLNKGDVVSLIKAGAFDRLTTKSKMQMFEMYFDARCKVGKEDKCSPIKIINKTHIAKLLDDGLITPEQSTDKAYCIQILNEDRRECGWANFKSKYCTGSELQWEMEVLNTYLSGDPFDDVYVPDWKSVGNGEIGIVGGTIISIKQVVTKKDGKKMAFLNLDSKGVTYDIVVFPNQFNEYIDLLKNGKCVVCAVDKDGALKGKLKSMETLDDYLKRTAYMQEKHRKETE